MTNFRMMLLSTAAIGLTSIAVTSVSAGEVEKKFGWSGHVNRVIGVADDGQDQSVVHNDPTSLSQSRARMKASAKSDSMTIGATIELALTSNNNGGAQSAGADSFAIRHSYLHISNSMGRIRAGDTAHAGEGYLGTQMDGASLAGGIVGTAFDGFLFNNKTVVTNVAAGTVVSTAHGSDFSSGRQSGVSYDTPTFGGFKATVSHVAYGSGSGEIQYGGDFNGVAVKAGAMFTTMSSSGATAHTTEDIQGYGAGFKLANGLSVSGNYKKRDLDGGVNTTNRADPEMLYGRIGYDMSNVSDLGKTSVAFAIRDVSDRAATGDQFDEYSLMFVQNLSDYGTQVYGGVTQLEYDTTLADFDDIAGMWLGMRVVF
jgi:hypothetical protein